MIVAFRDYLKANPDSPLNTASDEQLAKLLQMKKGFRVLREVDETSRFLFTPDEKIVYDPEAIEKVLKKQDGQGLNALRELRPLLAAMPEWTAHSLDELVKKYAEQKQLGLGKVAQPLRVAVTGSTVSPPISKAWRCLGGSGRLRELIGVWPRPHLTELRCTTALTRH